MKTLISWWRNAVVQAILWCVLIFAAFYFIYEPIAFGFDWEDILLLSLPLLLGLSIFQQLMRSTLWHRAFLGHGLLGIAWALTYPLLYHWSYTKPFYFYEFFPDFLFGFLLFVGLSLLHYFMVHHLPYRRSLSILIALIQWLLSLIPLIQIGYYINTWHCLTPATLMALYQTNPEEAFGFLKSSAGIPGLIGIGIGNVLLFLFYYWSNQGMNLLSRRDMMTRLRLGILSIACLACVIYLPFGFMKTDIVKNWTDVATYMKELQQYSDKHHEIYNDLHLETDETAANGAPGTIILVIGESASRNYMKVYNPSFAYDDTPWQSEMAASNPDFIFFKNAYSSYVQTVPTLERALTERNQYDDKPFLDSANILDVAKKAGYYTSWFSNQGVYGEYDTAISLIAKTADRPLWAHEAYMFSDKYDGVILPLLQQVEPYKNNFIVIHIMGSHIYYNDRYPHEFSKWKIGEVPKGKEAYANSQLYTDWVLQQIYTYAKDHLNLQAMIYFSDHGESLNYSHNPDIFDFDMARIPLWVYLSPTYEEAYPETTAILRDHENKYFTNDLLYDLVSGILQAPTNRYDRTRDFSNPNYRFNKYNLTTLLGQEPLTNDPEAAAPER